MCDANVCSSFQVFVWECADVMILDLPALITVLLVCAHLKRDRVVVFKSVILFVIRKMSSTYM